MTRKQLRDRVIKEIGLQEIEDYDEGTLVDDLVFEGTIDLLARTRCTVRCIHLQLEADVETYVLAKSILGLVDVEDGHMQRLRRDEPGPGFTLIRSDLLRVSPAPTETTEIDVWAVVRPSKMIADDDDLSEETFGAIPEEYHDAVFLYACWKAASYADDESATQGERYRAQYEGQDGKGGKLALIKSLVNRRGTSRAPRRRVRVRTIPEKSTWVG